MKNLIWIILFLGVNLQAQECTPFRKIPNYELSSNKSASIGYVACLHARGVVAEVGYKNIFIGFLAMGENHQSDAYTFLQYEYRLKGISFYGGPAYRVNNSPKLLIGRIGIDIKLYKRIWGTASILQLNPQLNYLHSGLKIVL
tara:strand:+ start:1217 stop:1645 length:429 start_codon:yes stop_codon:yes gene_type:complete